MAQQMQIGALAKSAGVTTRTIKYYEELGLLTATSKTGGGFRIFTADDVTRVVAIRKMRAVGLSLHTIKEVLDVRQTVSGLDTSPASPEEVETLVSRLEERLQHVDDGIRRLEDELKQGRALRQDLWRDLQICREYLTKVKTQASQTCSVTRTQAG